MNKVKKNILPFICFGLTLLFLSSFHLFFENEIHLLLDGKKTVWTTEIINWLYPRFEAEQHRFSPDFFLAKTHSVFYRGASVFFLLGLVSTLIINNSKVSEKWDVFWNQPTSNTTIEYLNKIYFFFLLFFTWDLSFDLYELQTAARFFYQPVFILKLTHLNFPSFWLSNVLLVFFYGSALWSFFSKHRKWTTFLVILLFIYFESLLNSFGKVDHGLTTFIYTGIGLSLINFINQGEKTKVKWPLSLTQLWICLCYFLAGIEKITTSGIDWVLGDSLQDFLFAHHTTLGLWLADYSFICSILMSLTLVLQLGFISVLLNKKLLFPFLLLGICFHWGTTLFLGINQLMNPWIITYLFFIDWDKVVLFINKKRI